MIKALIGPVHAGETFAATSAEYFSLKAQLESESFPPEAPGGPPRFYSQLPHEQRAKLLKERLKKYCQRVNQPVKPLPVYEIRHLSQAVGWHMTSCSRRARRD